MIDLTHAEERINVFKVLRGKRLFFGIIHCICLSFLIRFEKKVKS